MAQVAPAVAANNNNVPAVEEDEEETQLDLDFLAFAKEVDELLATQESFVKRLFGSAPNYRTKMGLPEGAPGKREFRTMNTTLRKLKGLGERQYKKSKPKQKRVTVSTTTGFNRLVILSPALTKFMKLGDWGLVSPVDPTRGVITHGAATRFMSIYVGINNLHNKGQKSTWKANAAIEELFAANWEECKVDKNAIQYTDVQKLLAKHMDSIAKDTAERRAEDQYRHKISDEGEYGKAVKSVLDLRKLVEDQSKDVLKDNDHVLVCQNDRPGQAIGSKFLAQLKTSVAQYDKLAAELRTACKAADFDIAADFPLRPKIVAF